MPDTTGPTLTGLRFPTQISLANGRATSTFYFSASDSSGISLLQITLEDANGNDLGGGISYSPSGNTWTSGERSAQMKVETDELEGVYRITSVRIKDTAGNETQLNADQLQAMGFQRQVTVVERDDVMPVLTKFDIDDVTIDVTTSNQTQNFSIEATDEGNSGLYSVYFDYKHVGTNKVYTGPGINNFTGTGTISATWGPDSLDGTYEIVKVYVKDKAGNVEDYDKGELDGMHFDTSFTVTKDKVKPVLTGFDIDDVTIDISAGNQTQNFLITATDQGRGLDSVYFDYRHVETNTIYTGRGINNFTGTGTISATWGPASLKGTYEIVKVYLKDKAGNLEEYDRTKLDGMHFDTTFTVYADGVEPTLTLLDFPPTVDVSQGAASFRLEAHASDGSGSGVSKVFVRFAGNPFDDADNWIELTGDAQGWTDGVGIATLTLPADTAAGTYQLEAVRVVDKAGNVNDYTAADLTGSAFDKSFTVTNGDTTKPTLTFLDFPASVDVGAGPASFRLEARATDAGGSGVSKVFVQFVGNPFDDADNWIELNGDVQGWADGAGIATLSLPADTPVGTYQLGAVRVVDAAGNVKDYTAAELTGANFDKSFTVTDSGGADTEAPVLESLTSSTLVDIRTGAKPLSFTAEATDATGVESLAVNFDKVIQMAEGPFSGALLAGNGDSWDDGASSGSVTIAAGAAPGAYELASIRLTDTLGNDVTITATQAWTQYGIDVGFFVLNNAIAVAPADIRRGNPGANNLVGTAGNNVLYTLAGNDTLNGAGGSDWLYGGSGNDTYLVDASDKVVEDVTHGVDWVRTTTTYALALGSEVERLSVFDAAGTAAVNLTGNEFVNQLTGNAGANRLDGGGKGDVMTGLAGDDVYVVNDAADRPVEAAGGGTDTVLASVNYVLQTGAQVERLHAIDRAATAALQLTGNEFINVIVGNAGANRLDGKAGADVMEGLAGNDTYYVDNANDLILEAAGQGTDKLYAAASYVLRAGVSVEALATIDAASVAAINLTGNEIANQLTGNAGGNTLDGKGGADVMSGAAGDDVYIVDNVGDRAVEAVNAGIDHVKSSVTFTLGVNVENLTLTGAAAINGTGNALANVITGNAAANVLDGKAGADTMAGGGGNDTYVVDQVGDVVIEAVNAGTDLVQSAVTWTLGPNQENLELKGGLAINGTGNELANVIVGNNAANVLSGLNGADTIRGGGGNDTLDGGECADSLDGGTGADTMTGGAGDDVFVVDSVGDQTIEGGNGGTDTVQSSVTRTLGANLENLVLTGSTAINGTGNTLGNEMEGNGAANTLAGLAGNDYLYGFGGADSLDGGDGSDELFGGSGKDTLRGGAGVDYFAFNTTPDAATNIDVIADFSLTDDYIALDDAIFGNLRATAGGAQIDAKYFRSGAAAADADDRIIFNSATGALMFDADGLNGAAAVQFATLNVTLRAIDFAIF